MKTDPNLILTIAKAQAVRETLEFLTGGDAYQAGARAHLLAWILGCSPCKTQVELAQRIGRTPARVCQMLRTFKRAYRNVS